MLSTGGEGAKGRSKCPLGALVSSGEAESVVVLDVATAEKGYVKLFYAT